MTAETGRRKKTAGGWPLDFAIETYLQRDFESDMERLHYGRKTALNERCIALFA